MKWFASDFHFTHENIIKYNNRPFQDKYHMDEVLIDNINSLVKENDELYSLGDFALCNKQQTNEILSKIKCKNIYFILGNHDGYIRDISNITVNVKWIKQYYELKYNNHTFILFHYPILVWNKKHHGAIHLYGHCHSEEKEHQIPHEYMKNAFNMNCELWDFKPVDIDTIISWHDPEANKIH